MNYFCAFAKFLHNIFELLSLQPRILQCIFIQDRLFPLLLLVRPEFSLHSKEKSLLLLLILLLLRNVIIITKILRERYSYIAVTKTTLLREGELSNIVRSKQVRLYFDRNKDISRTQLKWPIEAFHEAFYRWIRILSFTIIIFTVVVDSSNYLKYSSKLSTTLSYAMTSLIFHITISCSLRNENVQLITFFAWG